MLITLLDASGTTIDQPFNLIQYGVMGIILLMFMTGHLVSKPTLDDLKLERERDRALWDAKVGKFTEVVEDNTKALKTVYNELAELTETVKGIVKP